MAKKATKKAPAKKKKAKADSRPVPTLGIRLYTTGVAITYGWKIDVELNKRGEKEFLEELLKQLETNKDVSPIRIKAKEVRVSIERKEVEKLLQGIFPHSKDVIKSAKVAIGQETKKQPAKLRVVS